MGLIEAIKSLLDSINAIADAYNTKIANQGNTEVVKEKKDLKKASNYAESIIAILDKYTYALSDEDFRKYNKLRTKFFRVN